MPGSSQNADPPRGADSDEDAAGSAREAASEFRRELEAHLKARAELLAIETREAGQFVARKLAAAVAAAALVVGAYALLLAAGVSLAGQWLELTWPAACRGRGWQFAAIAAALLHLAVAFLLVTRLKRRPPPTLFEFTRTEFRKDRQWLQKNHSRNKSGDSR